MANKKQEKQVLIRQPTLPLFSVPCPYHERECDVHVPACFFYPAPYACLNFLQLSTCKKLSGPTKREKNYGINIFDYEGHNLWHTW